MPITEAYPFEGSGQDDNKSRRASRSYPYLAIDYPNLGVAKLALESYGIPATISISGVPDLIRATTSWEQLTPDTWRFVVSYGHPDNRREDVDTGSYLFAFDTTGGRQRITQTLSRKQAKARPGEAVINTNGLIGWDGERANGVEIVVPALQFEVTKRQPRGVITHAYVRTLRGLTGKKNSGTFLSYAAGEVAFLGARGRQSTEGDPEVTYFFVVEENQTGLTIDDITGINKDGQDYLWVYYEPHEDFVADVLTAKPHSVFVDEVRKAADFSALSI